MLELINYYIKNIQIPSVKEDECMAEEKKTKTRIVHTTLDRMPYGDYTSDNVEERKKYILLIKVFLQLNVSKRILKH